ncbi:hypothetical protein BS50DRAFT_672813 [Corynespora cassiicola Philippines]|uniref:Uncharacterized protein n=1 Tax=Corynespora cassiicola Philippines TaxID=1448308 RepID=A0A2T2P3K4_CORCC|nr:hypothetical protein BS50DRAFT_672813 [Corynespora cassiicola Philippines]
MDSTVSSSRAGLAGPQLSNEAALSPDLSEVPATPDGDVAASCPEAAVHLGLPPAQINHEPLLELSVPPTLPSPSASLPAQTPPVQDAHPAFALDFAGSALFSTHVSLPTPPIVKNAHNLRLPSFDQLGIASPHPDRLPLFRSNHSFSSLGAGPLSNPEDPLHARSLPFSQIHQIPKISKVPQVDGSGDDPAQTDPQPAKRSADRIIPIVTPPTEPGTFSWGSIVNAKPASVGSPPSSEPAISPNLNTLAGATSLAPTSTVVVPTPANIHGAVGMAAWAQEVKDIITTESGCLHLDSVRVLSHALPCPSLTGHIFAQVIATIHDRTTSPTAWINVFHAVPGRFTLSDLPKSPPSTPGPVVGGDEYFTSKVFDSAVAIPDYQLDAKLLPPSPRPVVPPGTVNISVVERYIPPTNANEFAEMFLIKGRSLLYDRLVELSFDDGLLLFIYPTRAGARTFMQEYLGPILDPLLRTITVVHDLSSDLGKSLGQMSAVDRLDDYDALKSQIENFCGRLSEATPPAQAAGGKTPRYTLVHAAREEVMLERSAWASDWWVKQEKPRVREAVTKYFRKTKKLPTHTEMTSTTLIQEVLDGVAHREIDQPGPAKGVEVGVFIVKKTLSVVDG